MASTPSASSLSAVLRCRGNLWTRNPPTKRPAAAAYSLGLSGGALRDSAAERSGSNRGSEWKTSLRGERPVAGRGLSVACLWDTGEEENSGEVSKKEDKFCDPELWQSAQFAAPRVQNAPVRQLRRATAILLGNKFSTLVHMIHQEESAETESVCWCISQLPPGVLKLSIITPTGSTSLVSAGWSSLKVTCVSIASLLSRLMCLKLLVSPGPAADHHSDTCSSNRTPQHKVLQQAHGQIQASSQDKFRSGPEITGDRPD